MTLPVEWRFTRDHSELDESGALNTGEGTLADWACTVALTPTGDLLEDVLFGAGLASEIEGPNPDGAAIGAKLRGYLLDDARVEDVAVDGQTKVGTIELPVCLIPADDGGEFDGPLNAEMVEKIIADWELEAT